MNIRGKEIYVSGKTKKRLYWLLQLEKESPAGGGMDTQGLPKIVTMDEIAERLLNEKIEADYPNIKSMEKRMAALEEQMISELSKGKQT